MLNAQFSMFNFQGKRREKENVQHSTRLREYATPWQARNVRRSTKEDFFCGDEVFSRGITFDSAE